MLHVLQQLYLKSCVFETERSLGLPDKMSCLCLILNGALALQVLSLMVGGGMALRGAITPEQLTTFVLYVEFVTAASLSVCDQWGRACTQERFEKHCLHGWSHL